MSWPQSQEYNEAIQSPASRFADPELRTGAAVADNDGVPLPRSGTFADVYEVRCPNGSRWAVKCFTREVPGLRDRYLEISRCLRQAQLPFTVEFTYLEQGMRLRGSWYPVLKMQWVEGFTFNQFIRQHLDKPVMFGNLLQIWGRLATRLRAAGLAHADLQHGNVLLVPGRTDSALAVKLIDYDGMYVPALAEKPSGEVGHPAYQHPQRLREGTYNAEVDRFPLLLIAASLRCLQVGGRALWEKYDNRDNLLFRERDLKVPAESALFRELEALPDAGARGLVGQLREALAGRLEAAPLLDALLSQLRPEMAVTTVPVAMAPAQDRGATQLAEPKFLSTSKAELLSAKTRLVVPVAAPGIFEAKKTQLVAVGVSQRTRQPPKTSPLLLYGIVGAILASVVLLTLTGGVGLWWMNEKRSSTNRQVVAREEKERLRKAEAETTSQSRQPEPTAVELRAKFKEEEEEAERKRGIEKKEVERKQQADEEEAERKQQAAAEAAKQRAAQAKGVQDAEDQRKLVDLLGEPLARTFKDNGGTCESAATIERGLVWLAMHQSPDGSWSMTEFPSHGRDAAWPKGEQLGRCGCQLDNANAGNDVAGTAFGLLPFLASGQTHKPAPGNGKNDYSKNISAGLKFLMKKQGKDGDFGGGMYCHALATIALCEAFRLTNDPTLKVSAQRGINYILYAQDPQGGGWRYTPKTAGDLSVSGWQLAALKSGQQAGLTVPQQTFDKYKGFLSMSKVKKEEKLLGFCYMPVEGNKATPAMTAVGLRGLIYLGSTPTDRDLVDGVESLMKSPPGQQSIVSVYYEYYATQVMHQISGDSWQFWNNGPDGKNGIRDSLIARQDKGLNPKHVHQLGSWDGNGASGGGRVMATSLNLLSLKAPYELLSMYRRTKKE